MSLSSSTHAISERIRSIRYSFLNTLPHVTTGGEWANAQPVETRRSLTWFWFDGFFASASDNIVATYLVVFLLAIGATQSQIGMMSSLTSLTAAIVLLPGAWLVERIGRRKGLVLFGGGWARIVLLLLAIIPVLFSGPALITIAIALSISRDAMANLAFPAWISLTGDVVPIEGRGRYFASRNFFMGITGMTATFLVGQILTRVTGNQGYQIALVMAFLFGACAIYSFAHITDRPRPAPARIRVTEGPHPHRASMVATVRDIFSHRDFVQFGAVSALWNISLNFAGPFFSVYLVQNLHADAALVGWTSIASTVSGMLIQVRLGHLNDRWGERKLTVISGLLIPFVPLMWVFIQSPWLVIPINMVSGALWGAYGMGSFNYLLKIIPTDRRARYSAIFQVVVTISLAAGAALGSIAINQIGFQGVFAGSAIGRMIAALLFALISIRAGSSKMKPVPA
jgi:MFS family permease